MSRKRSQPVGAKAAYVFGVVTAVGAVAGLLAVVLFILFDHPHRAAVTLGAGMLAMGLLRGLWPGRPWFSSRNRFLDAAAYVGVGVAILYLSPWTAAGPPLS